VYAFLKKLTSPFSKLGTHLGQRLRTLFSRKIDENSYEELEQLFYESDLGTELSMELVKKIRSLLQKNPSSSTEDILKEIRKELLAIFQDSPSTIKIEAKPHVILIVGVNGSGKTTTIGKLAAHYRSCGLHKLLIAACDTFRAASNEQLASWAETTGADIVKAKAGSNPSAIAFDALDAAQARQTDLVLIDTAGRLQTKTELMRELEKIYQVCQKKTAGAPHEVLLVVDATIGQNALDQARSFNAITPLTGIVLTKLDGSSKGGIAIAIQKYLKIPILWIGTGEHIENLQPFNPEPFINELLNL